MGETVDSGINRREATCGRIASKLAPTGFVDQTIVGASLLAIRVQGTRYTSLRGSRILYQATYSAGRNISVSTVATTIPPIIA